MYLTHYILNKYVPKGKNPTLSQYRGKIGMAQGWVSIVINLLLFGIKLVFGIISNSIALITDAFHSLSDMASSAVVVFGFKMSSKPADKEHPFGHGRAETIAALTIAILIGFTGIECLKTSIARLMDNEKIIVNQIIITIVIITIILKEGMARLSYNLGKIINSDTLKADALHHRTDMFSSILVLFAFVGVFVGYPKLDAMMGLGVAALMLYSAYKVARNAIDDLLGKPVDLETIANIKLTAMKVKGVLNIHDIVVHSYGAHKFISLHIEIPEGENPEYMHELADQVEKLLADEMNADIVTHIDPVTVSGEEFENVQKIILNNIRRMNLDTNFQDLRIVKNKNVESILFQIPIPVEFQQKEKIRSQCNQDLQQAYPNCNVTIEFKSQMSME